MISVHVGDSRLVLKTLADASVDAVVTDPPYELGFMGAKWDASGIAYDVDLWREVFRVLKPGGHVASFGGTRTFHRMAVAIEDAGFEIRDQLAWTYGSGFPKSLDVSKAIDKRRTEDVDAIRVVCRFLRAAMDEQGLNSRDVAPAFDCNPRLVDHWAARDTDSQPTLPTPDQWAALKVRLNLSDAVDAEVARLNGRKGDASDRYNAAPIVGEHDGEPGGFTGLRFAAKDRTIRERTDAARDWQGWGTALKPAWEPICLARKPFPGTVAGNVLKHGTGALNVDACRIGVDGGTTRSHQAPFAESGWRTGHEIVPLDAGRWPANFCHDGSAEVVAGFPDDAGSNGGGSPGGHAWIGGDVATANGDVRSKGSAARFFYCAKAGKLDRLGSDHPTIKPVELMRWLVRLITPPGGIVLDPFAGSGSTGIAAHVEGFNAHLIELRPEAADDIRRRLAHVQGAGGHTAGETKRSHLKRGDNAAKARGDDSPLFAGLTK